MLSINPRPLLTIMLIGAICVSAARAADPYTRVLEQPDGQIVLEMCTRTFAPVSGDGPRVHLVSAIHIADQPYYGAMQDLLERYDTVLFEGVKPAGLDAIDPDLDDDAKVAATRDRLELLVSIAERYRADHNDFPAGMGDLRQAEDPRIRAIVESIELDAWGNRIGTERNITINNEQKSSTIAFTSLGADAQPGGEGINADIVETSALAIAGQAAPSSPEGIQTQLANALRVSFQLDEMDTTKPGWVNADMDINQLQHALSEYGEDSTQILSMLDGESFSAKIAGFVLGFVARSPQLSSMMKLVMMDMLALAEETDIMAQQEVLSKVIVDGRNDVVIDYLKDTLAQHPGYKDIGIFYGAGHMPGLEESLIEMGFKPVADEWAPAMTVDPEETGLSEMQIKMMRNMIKSSLQQQMGR